MSRHKQPPRRSQANGSASTGNYFVKAKDGKEVRFHTDKTTQRTVIPMEGGYMMVRRKIKQLGKKVGRNISAVKRKVVKKRAVVAAKARRVARTPGKGTHPGAKSLMRKTAGAKRTTRSKAREAGKAMGTFLGKAIGNTERLINKTAETAKDILS